MHPPLTAVLWGPEHPHLDRTASAVIGSDVAVALDRGRHPKAYPYVDPNEDVVAAVVDADRTLLVVADGHHGQEAAVEAVGAVLRWAAPGLPPTLGHAEAIDVVHEVNRHVHAVTRAADSVNTQSGSTLALVLVSDGACWWASMGDSAIFVGTVEGVRRLGKDRSRYLGRPMHHRDIRAALQHGHTPLGVGDAVVVCSDGLHEFTGRRAAAEAVRAALGGDDPLAVAVAVIDAAGDAGAGDNVAVAVCRPR